MKDKYIEVEDFINDTVFISAFICGKEKYNAISMVLHNSNRHQFAENHNKSLKEYTSFNKVLLETDFKVIHKEFEDVINLLRKVDDIKIIISLDFQSLYPILALIDLLWKKR